MENCLRDKTETLTNRGSRRRNAASVFSIAFGPARLHFAFDKTMRPIPNIGFAMILGCIGCSAQHSSPKPTAAEYHGILNAFAQRDRNIVSVALWTLDRNGIPVPQRLDFNAPYSEAQPQIREILHSLRELPPEKLSQLDLSFAYHLRTSSTYWIYGDWP